MQKFVTHERREHFVFTCPMLLPLLGMKILFPKMAAKMERNPGVVFDPSWIASVRINYACTKARGETLGTRRSIKKEWQAAWLLRAITCTDLTTLSGKMVWPKMK